MMNHFGASWDAFLRNRRTGKRQIVAGLVLLVCWAGYPFGAVQAASKAGNIWYFGIWAGLDFNSGAPVALTNGALITNEGCATISDTDGHLLFYTDGITVWNQNHTPMPNGMGLMGHPSSTQSGVIVPQPGSSDIYYVFTVGAQADPNGLRYSTVDMTLAGGLGDVVISTKNTPLWTPTTEKITAVRHQNNEDIWVIAHGWNNNTFRAYLVTNAGVNPTPIVTHIGTVHNGDNARTIGYLKASPDGSRLALAVYTGFLELFDFDNATGVVSNPIRLHDSSYYGVEFSPDGTKLYGASHLNKNIYQFDLAAADIPGSAKLVGTSSASLGSLQLAPDHKIYVARFGGFFLGVINNPNELGAASHYVDQGFYLKLRASMAGLPTFIQTFFEPAVCQLYGVHDEGLNNSQFLTIAPAPDYTVAKLGNIHPTRDIEALDIHPDTGKLYAASGDNTDKRGYLYTVDKDNGSLLSAVDIRSADGTMNFTEVDALSFHPDNTLWGWDQHQGLLTIDTDSGVGTVQLQYQGEIEDLTWDTKGEVLYAVQNNHNNDPDSESDQNGVTLWAYTVNNGQIETKCQDLLAQSPEIEALEALDDGTLLFGFHNKDLLLMGTIDPNSCKVSEIKTLETGGYNDVEGIAWPPACGTQPAQANALAGVAGGAAKIEENLPEDCKLADIPGLSLPLCNDLF